MAAPFRLKSRSPIAFEGLPFQAGASKENASREALPAPGARSSAG